MGPAVRRLCDENYRAHGAREIWKAARRASHDIGRDQVARLMRSAGVEGVRRTKRVHTTRPEQGAARHPYLVRRDFTATEPNQLRVTDLTYVPTWAWIAYVCFITDACSRTIVGWRVASHMRATMVLDAIEMARWSRGTQLQVCGATPTPARNSLHFGTANASPRSAPFPRSVPSATATTTLSPRPSAATTRLS